MLTGRFGETSGRPYLEGRVVFPRLNVQSDVSFLVDTGADSSLLSAADAIVMRVDFSRIGRRSEAQGLGGIVVATYVERGVVIFSEPGVGIWAFDGDLEIVVPEPKDYTEIAASFDPEASSKMPSLLGREILDRCCLTYDPTNDNISLEIRSSDLFIDRSSITT